MVNPKISHIRRMLALRIAADVVVVGAFVTAISGPMISDILRDRTIVSDEKKREKVEVFPYRAPCNDLKATIVYERNFLAGASQSVPSLFRAYEDEAAKLGFILQHRSDCDLSRNGLHARRR